MIYIAAPFFNEHQLSAVKTVENILTRGKFEFFSPRLHGVNVGTLSPEERKDGGVMTKVFLGNVKALNDTTLLLACIDDKDQGTNFELGYYYRGWSDLNPSDVRCPTIITWSARGSASNLMIQQATGGHCSTLPAIEDFFKEVRAKIEPDFTKLDHDMWSELTVGYAKFGKMAIEER